MILLFFASGKFDANETKETRTVRYQIMSLKGHVITIL